MTRLVNGRDAVVAVEKVRDYLLRPATAGRSGKAGLYERFGFLVSDWPLLAETLKRHALDNEVVATSPSDHGLKFIVECSMPTPDGRNPCFRSIWIVRHGETFPRFVTASPAATPAKAP